MRLKYDSVDVFAGWENNTVFLIGPMTSAYPDLFWTGIVRPKIGPCYISKKLNSYLVNTCIINDQQALFFMSLVLRNVSVERSFKRAALKTCVRSNVQFLIVCLPIQLQFSLLSSQLDSFANQKEAPIIFLWTAQ